MAYTLNMRIGIIGPAHPYKGGIAQHTTELAHRLTAAGHTVDLISWRSQYPFFYPGQQFVAEDQPELPLHASTRRVLSWKNPAGWARWGHTLRRYDRLIFVWWVPTIQGPVYAAMLQALGRRRPHVTLLCHNVLPHEPRLGDRRLARAILRRCDQIITHTPAQATVAASLTTRPVCTVPLPLALPTLPLAPSRQLRRELLFFGFVRPYKGLDVLLQALATVPDVHLTIAGEFWGGSQSCRQLISTLGLQHRVTIIDKYLPVQELAERIAASDAVVLPYRHGTASWNVMLAHAYKVPVIATTAGSLGLQVRHDVDGLLCQPDNVDSLAKALQHFYKPGVARRLRNNVPVVSIDKDWQSYLQALDLQP